jgi:hypothetical protein
MEPIKCPSCDAELHCSHCGETFKTQKSIKLALANGIKYCSNCGEEIASTLSEALANCNN